MTSPFVDRVEYQVIGRDVNASGVFRDVANAADAAGDSLSDLGSDLDRVNGSIEDTADRMRQLIASLKDLSATREITVTTNIREVLGSVEDNRQVLDLLNDRFENLTVNVVATVNQLVQLNDGLQTIDDNRTAVIDLGDDVRQLTQNVTATVDSVVALNDGLQTIDDNRTAVIDLGDDVRQLTQNVTATVDSVVQLNDGLQTIDDNRNVIVTVDDDFQNLTQSITATVDSVVSLNDGIQTIDDNRNVIVTVGNDFRTLSQDIDATVDSVVRLNDGIATIDDNRNVVTTIDGEFRTLTQDIDTTVNSVDRLNDGINTVDDNRIAITGVDDDFRTLTTDVDRSRLAITQFGDGIATVDDNRPAITSLGDGFNELATDIERARGRVVDLNRDIERTRDIDVDRDFDIGRQVVETISSDRDRIERAGLIAGAALGHGMLVAVSNAISSLPFGKIPAGIIGAIASSSGPVAAALIAVVGAAAAAIAIVVVNALTAGVLLALAGGVIALGVIASLGDPRIKEQAKFTGATIASTLRSAALESGFTDAMVAGLVQIREQFPQLKAGLSEVFAAAGPLIKPLIDGIMGFAREALPGMAEALRNSKPIIDKLAESLPKLGRTMGEFFAKLSTVAPQAAAALGVLLDFAMGTIEVTGRILTSIGKLEPLAELIFKLIGFLGGSSIGTGLAIFEAFAAFIDWLLGPTESLAAAMEHLAGAIPSVVNGLAGLLQKVPGLGVALGITGTATGVLGGAFGSLKTPTDGAGEALGRAAEKAKGATNKFTELKDSIIKAFDAANTFIGLGDAQASMYEAMERGAKRVADANAKDLKKGIDLSTAAGRDNWKTLRDIASTANAAAKDITDMGGSTADAAAVTATARAKFLALAGAMNISAADAKILADKMFGIPDVDPTVTLQDKASKGIRTIDGKLDGLDAYNAMPSVGLLDNASRGIGRIQNLLYKIDGDSATVTVNVKQNGSVSNPLKYAASGGPVWGPGPKGIDSKLYMLAPGEHIMTAREVDAAGGHAAVMEFRRSLLGRGTPRGMGVAEQVAGRSSGRGGGIDAHTLRQALSGMTLIIDDRTGRTAQLIARGG